MWFTDNTDSVIAGANCKRVYEGPHIGEWNSACWAAVFRKGWDESVAFSEARHAGILYMEDHLDELPLVVVARVGRAWQVWAPFDHIGNDGRPHGLWIASISVFWLMAILGVFGALQLRRAGRLMWPLGGIAAFVTMLAAATYGNGAPPGAARRRAPRARRGGDRLLLVPADGSRRRYPVGPSRLCGAGDRRRHRAGVATDDEELGVAQVRDLTDRAHPTGCGSRSARRRSASSRRRGSPPSPRAAHRSISSSSASQLSSLYDTTIDAGVDAVDARAERVGHLPLAVERRSSSRRRGASTRLHATP